MVFETSRSNSLTEKVKRYCIDIGIDVIGFADVVQFNRYQEQNRPQSFLKEACSVIVIGIQLKDPILDAWHQDDKNHKKFQFADSVLENYCHRIKEFLLNEGYNSKILPYSPGIFLKEAAALAGIGSIGKNNLLISERFGPRIRLRALATNAPLTVEILISSKIYCTNCNKCIEACPGNAFSNERYDKAGCLKYCLTNLQMLSKYTSLWCTACIDACPVGKE